MKKPELSLNPQSLQRSLVKAVQPIGKHSTIIIILITLGILIYSILAVQLIISQQNDETYRAEQSVNRITGNFDQETITKINNLKASTDSNAIELPQGRRNPFIN